MYECMSIWYVCHTCICVHLRLCVHAFRKEWLSRISTDSNVERFLRFSCAKSFRSRSAWIMSKDQARGQTSHLEKSLFLRSSLYLGMNAPYCLTQSKLHDVTCRHRVRSHQRKWFIRVTFWFLHLLWCEAGRASRQLYLLSRGCVTTQHSM